MALRWFASILILPANAVLIIPGLILYGFRNTHWVHALRTPSEAGFWFALMIGLIGLALASWSMSLFIRFGEGTPAPWDPPRRFIVRGPYRHVRNPMISGVILILVAEALLSASWPLLLWMLAFASANAVYIPWVEERRLERRFGAPYAAYREHVPRWFPRLSGWPPKGGSVA